MSIQAMKQALEALDEVTGWQWAGPMSVMNEVEDAITALRRAIEEAEKQETVAWIVEFESGDQELHFEEQAVGETCTPLGRFPPRRQPLTSAAIRKWWSSENGFEDCNMAKLDDFEQVVRAVEAAHGIKEKQHG